MEYKDLMGIGFNMNEAKVYLSLLKFGKADANQLIADTKFHKNIVYDNLEKLIDKGLVTFIIEEGRRIFQVASSDMFMHLFEEQEKELQKRKKIASHLAQEIQKSVKKIPFKSEAIIYRGVRGVKVFFNEILRERNDFFVFGAPKESVEIMGEHFWRNFELKRVKKKMKVKMIFNQSLRDFGKILMNQYTSVRYFEKDFEPLTETHIEKDKIAIIVWTEEPILFLIRDKNVADSYLKFFEDLWKQAKN